MALDIEEKWIVWLTTMMVYGIVLRLMSLLSHISLTFLLIIVINER